MYRQIALSYNLQKPIELLLELPITWHVNCHERAQPCFENRPRNLTEIMERLSKLGHVLLVGSYVKWLVNPSSNTPGDIDIQLQCEVLPTDTNIIGTLFNYKLEEPPTLPIFTNPPHLDSLSSVKPIKTASPLISKPLNLAVLRDPKNLNVFGFTLSLNGSIEEHREAKQVKVDISIITLGESKIFDFYHLSIGWSYHKKTLVPIIPQESPESAHQWVTRAKKLEATRKLESDDGSETCVQHFWSRFSKHIALGYTAPLLEWNKAIASIKSTHLKMGLTANVHRKLEKLPKEIHHRYCLTIHVLVNWGKISDFSSQIEISPDQIQHHAQSILHNLIRDDEFKDVILLKHRLKSNPELWTPIVWDWMKNNWKIMESNRWILSCWGHKTPRDWRVFSQDLFPILNSLAQEAVQNPCIDHELQDIISKNIHQIKTHHSKDLSHNPHFKEWLSRHETIEALNSTPLESPIVVLTRSINSDGFNVETTTLQEVGILNIPIHTLNNLLNKIKTVLMQSYQIKKKQVSEVDAEKALAMYARLLDEDYTLLSDFSDYKAKLSEIAKIIYPRYMESGKASPLLCASRSYFTDEAWVQFLLLPLDETDVYTKFSHSLEPNIFTAAPFITGSMLPILEEKLGQQKKTTLAYIVKTNRIIDAHIFCTHIGKDYAIEGFKMAIHQGSYHLATTFLKRCPSEYRETQSIDSVLKIRYQLKELIATNKILDALIDKKWPDNIQQIVSDCQMYITNCFRSPHLTHLFDIDDIQKLLLDIPELLIIPFKTPYGQVCLLEFITTFKIIVPDSQATPPIVTWTSELLIKNYGVIRDLFLRSDPNLTGIISTMIQNTDINYTSMMLAILTDCYASNTTKLQGDMVKSRNISLLLNKPDLLSHPLIESIQKELANDRALSKFRSSEYLDSTALCLNTQNMVHLQKWVMGHHKNYFISYCMSGSLDNIKRFINITCHNPISLHLCHNTLLKVLLCRMLYKAFASGSSKFLSQENIQMINTILQTTYTVAPHTLSEHLIKAIDQLDRLFNRIHICEPYDTVNWEYRINTDLHLEPIKEEEFMISTEKFVLRICFSNHRIHTMTRYELS